ncbi:hypothetical protein MTo_00715 [Microcystis aeruginosa NIES-1211]|uniref:DUF5615 family PIN-like protein n=1 Tax=Microcystis TaxID=1125 RepID=UPI000D92707C|nr:DUF5615 family PIN-like protein [Microcystis aeruginosa]GBL13425.1 hypothetical protein MTo_00715 [Microcystis aeruginosa NIES-1211]
MSIFASLYMDEDMSALVATLLRSRGLDVTTVPEQSTLGKTDSEQLEFAASLGSVLSPTTELILNDCIFNS